jgi:hypothetical protein
VAGVDGELTLEAVTSVAEEARLFDESSRLCVSKSLCADKGGDDRARICGSSERGREIGNVLGRNLREETDDFCRACLGFTGISGMSGMLDNSEVGALVYAASVPSCKLEDIEGFRERGETPLLMLSDLLEESPIGDTLDELSAGDVVISGRIELVFMLVLIHNCGRGRAGPGYRMLGGRTGCSRRELSFGDQYNSPLPGPASG